MSEENTPTDEELFESFVIVNLLKFKWSLMIIISKATGRLYLPSTYPISRCHLNGSELDSSAKALG